MGLFSSSKSSTSQSVTTVDERVAASEGSSATHVATSGQGSSVIIGSDELANAALEANRDGLLIATDLIRETLNKAFQSTDNRAEAAENNLTAAQATAAASIQKGQQSADDRLIKLITLLAVTAVGALYLTKRK